jgi:hypothetical protein
LTIPVLLAAFAAMACGERPEHRVARRILENHRRHARVKPLPGAQVVRLALSEPSGGAGATGSGRLRWEGSNYRETTSSAGWTTSRGIQAGKSYLTDEDGVTRVTSEPILAELLTRSYFWRRAYLFDDLEGARLALGPADEKTVSVELTPRGGNRLRLVFTIAGELVAASSPGFELRFQGPARMTDRSRPGSPVEAEIRSITLPEDSMPDAQAGGWSARWSANPAEAPLLRLGRGIAVDATIGGLPARIAIDGDADGPLRVRPELARKLGLTGQRDVFGRQIARAGPVAVGSLAYPALFVEISEAVPALVLEISEAVPEGADAVAGGVFLRETILELDPAARRVRFYDPSRWVAPPGYFRGLLDDDGDRATAILRRGTQTFRLRAGCSAAGIVLTREAAGRVHANGSAFASPLDGLKWVTAELPTVPVSVAGEGFGAEWGEDGCLGFEPLLPFHVFLDMPRRWAYLRPLDAAAGVR